MRLPRTDLQTEGTSRRTAPGDFTNGYAKAVAAKQRCNSPALFAGKRLTEMKSSPWKEGNCPASGERSPSAGSYVHVFVLEPKIVMDTRQAESLGVQACADCPQQQGQPKISRSRVSAVGKLAPEFSPECPRGAACLPDPSEHPRVALHPRSRQHALGQAQRGARQALVLPGDPAVPLGAPPPSQAPLGSTVGCRLSAGAGGQGAVGQPTHPPRPQQHLTPAPNLLSRSEAGGLEGRRPGHGCNSTLGLQLLRKSFQIPFLRL